MEKSAAAKHSAAYRAREKAKNAKLGIEKTEIETPASIRAQLNEAMKAHGYKQEQELWQDMARSFLASSTEEQGRRLKAPDASAFVISEKLARQYEKKARAELRADPGDEVVAPINR